MLVSGRKSRGARLAGRSRLAKTRDRMRTETKSPARRGGALGWAEGLGPGGPSQPWGKAAPFMGELCGMGSPESWQRCGMPACG